MKHGKELPKVIDKSQADIDAAIAAIKASDIADGIKDFAISCIRLAVVTQSTPRTKNQIV